MVDLYRHKCSNCSHVVINDSFEMRECPNCDDKYASMLRKPSPEHDKEIMKEPTDLLSCPECGVKMAATATVDGKDWECRVKGGGCGFAGWRLEDGSETDIPAPEDLSEDDGVRQDAWSRYHRYKAGHFEYRE